MLPKPNRIRKQSEFDAIYKQHSKNHSKSFRLLIRYVDKSNCPRFGFVITKKIGNAVVRNKIRRRIREIIRTQLINFVNGVEVVVIVYPQIVELDFPQLKLEFNEACQKARIFNAINEK